MRALVVPADGRIELRETAEAALPGQCRIRVRMAGICGTDLQILAGYAGFSGIPGHEFVGVVEEVPSQEQSAWMGRRVVGEINVGCGDCRFCHQGVREHCTSRTVLGIRNHDGAFAEYLWLPAANLHAVPDDLDDPAAVFVEPVAAACRILEQVTVDGSADLAVIGDGRLGLLIAQVLRTTTPNVTVFGRHAEKLKIAAALGLDARISAGEPHSYDLVVDATGRAEGLTQALNLVRPRGTVVMKSTFHGEAALATWPIVVEEVTIVGSRCGPFDRAIELLSSGAVVTAPLVASTYRLDEYEAAFRAAATSLKVLFDLRADPRS